MEYIGSVVRELVCKPIGPDSWHVLFRVSYYKGKPNHAAATHHTSVYYTLMD